MWQNTVLEFFLLEDIFRGWGFPSGSGISAYISSAEYGVNKENSSFCLSSAKSYSGKQSSRSNQKWNMLSSQSTNFHLSWIFWNCYQDNICVSVSHKDLIFNDFNRLYYMLDLSCHRKQQIINVTSCWPSYICVHDKYLKHFKTSIQNLKKTKISPFH